VRLTPSFSSVQFQLESIAGTRSLVFLHRHGRPLAHVPQTDPEVLDQVEGQWGHPHGRGGDSDVGVDGEELVVLVAESGIADM
jgi:hypothetical protein